MGDRRENIKKTLGIPEYPWSSDDEETEIQASPELQSMQSSDADVGRPSVADNPGTSGQLPLTAAASQSSSLFRTPSQRSQLWNVPLNSRRTPTLTLRRNRHEIPLVRMARHSNNNSVKHYSAGLASDMGSADVQRIQAIRKINRLYSTLQPRSTALNLVQRPLPFQNVGANRSNRYLMNGDSSVSASMGLQRAQTMADIEYNNSTVSTRDYLAAQIRAGYFESLRSFEQPSGAEGGSGPGEGPSHSSDHAHSLANNNMPPSNTHSDDGFLEMDLNVNVNELAENVNDITVDNEPPEATSSGSNLGVGAGGDAGGGAGASGGDGDGDMEADGPGALDVSAMSLEEVIEIDAEPDAAAAETANDSHRSAPDDSQEPVAQTSSASFEVPTPQPHGVKRKREPDEDSCDLGTVKDFNQSLLRLLECPVCLEWMEPPMWQCRRGHLVCGRCRTRLAACPVCRTGFSSVRNRAMEGVAEMLRYPCRHGCGRDLQLRRRGTHEASCPARRYRCPAPACDTRPPLAHRDLALHLKNKHLSMVKVGRIHKFSMRVNSEQHDNWIIMTLGQLFHLRVDVDIRSWGVVVYVAYIGPKCNASDYAYEVTVTGQHNSRKLVYTRATHCDLECSSLNVSRQDCFHLTLDQALNFLRMRNRHAETDKFLHFSVEITRTINNDEDSN